MQAVAMRIAYADGHVTVTGKTASRRVSRSHVERVYRCRMEDELRHGDELFHILLLEQEFLLVGPFVKGGLGAVEALLKDRPRIPVEDRLVRTVPYRYRERGMWGLRAFPIPGLRFGSLPDLERFHLIHPEAVDGE